MPRPRFDRLPEEKRRSILDAAAREFAEHGFDGASYNRIIANAGVSKGAMYYYFDDKEDLYATVLVGVIDEWMSIIGDLPEVDSPAEFWKEFEDILARSMTAWREDPRAAEISHSFQRMRTTGEVGPALRQVMARGNEWATTLLERGRSVGAIRVDLPIPLLAELTMALDAVMDGWLAEHWDDMTQEEKKRRVHQAYDLFRRVCVPAAAASPADADGRQPSGRSSG